MLSWGKPFAWSKPIQVFQILARNAQNTWPIYVTTTPKRCLSKQKKKKSRIKLGNPKATNNFMGKQSESHHEKYVTLTPNEYCYHLKLNIATSQSVPSVMILS